MSRRIYIPSSTVSDYYYLKQNYKLALKNAYKGAELSKKMMGITM
ncbi:hypothetical protein N9K77_00985 [bacterium]|nr:hypothetical protein [bacterium]